MKRLLVLALVLGIIMVSAACSKKTDTKKVSNNLKKTSKTTAKEMKQESSHFGFMPATLDFDSARQAGGNWDRPFFELFGWGQIERSPGEFDFTEPDDYVRAAQENDFNILANIQPFAAWDQEANEGKFPEVQSPDLRGGRTRAKPNDLEAYSKFVKRLVERYDGDGRDDMPDLKYPIRYWEVANEPEMQNPPLTFFQGPPEDYFEILKKTYEAVKSADPKAKVLNGGMAGMQDFMTEYWQGVFDLGGGKYFDIANIHSIGHGEPLNIPEFKDFLAKNNIDKPIWVTEVQIEDRRDKQTEEQYADSLARSYIYALANGVDKLFYVNLKLPDQGLPAEGEGGPGFSDLSTLISEVGEQQPLFHVHKVIFETLDKPFTAEKIAEEINTTEAGANRKITVGHYKFTVDGRIIYALWGGTSLPAEITGKVSVTDMNGNKEEKDASEITLTESPIFVETRQD